MNELAFINKIVFVANKLNCSVMIITKEFASAVNESQTLFVTVAQQHIPITSFESLATRDRISTLFQRLTMFENSAITYKVNDSKEVEDINISAKRNKINFKCMKKAIILGHEKSFKDIAQGTRPKPPKKINAPHHCKVIMTPEEFIALEQLSKTIDTEHVLINSDKEVSIVLSSDSNGEKGKIDLNDAPILLANSTSCLFAHRYDLKEFIKTFKCFFDVKSTNVEFIVCTNGFITFIVDDIFNITILPRKVTS